MGVPLSIKETVGGWDVKEIAKKILTPFEWVAEKM